MCDIRMAKVSGEYGQFMFHIHPGPIPTDEGPCGEGVTEVLESRAPSASMHHSRGAHAHRHGKLCEGAPYGVGLEPPAALGDKEGAGPNLYAELIPASSIVCQSVSGRLVDRYEVRFSMLRLAD